MYDRLVIPVDGSQEAKQAAKRGLKLAQVFDATVAVIHVIDQRIRRLTRTTKETDQLSDRSEGVLTEIEELASDVGHPITTTLTDGKPSVQISQYADEQNADLIVIGRQGMTGLGKRLLGGVTEQVLHRSNSPVLVVPSSVAATETESGSTTETEREYARILIPTDGSETAESATQHGVAVARNYDSTIHVLNVIDLQAAGGLFSAGGLEQSFVERLEAEGNESVDRVAAEIERSASELEVKRAVERTTSFKGAGTGICEYNLQHDTDLIVMGSHGRSNLKRQFLGSIASTVLRTVDTPVLVVKRPVDAVA